MYITLRHINVSSTYNPFF